MSYISQYKTHYSTILKLGLPLLLGQLCIIITGYADTIMVGNYSTEALASASFVNNLCNFVLMLGLGFSYGLTPIVGAQFATKSHIAMGDTVRNGILINVLYAMLCNIPMLLCYVFIDHIGLPQNLLPTIRPYLLIILLSMIPLAAVNALRQFTDAINDTKVSMTILIAGNVLNIALNYLLIYGKYGAPELGLTGAGIATLTARTFMLIAYIGYLCCRKSYHTYRQSIVKAKFCMASMKSIFLTSYPVSLQIGMETAIFSVAALFAGWLGTESMAAIQVLTTMSQLGFMVYYSFGAATSIKVANYCGTNDYIKVREVAHAGYMIILASAVVSCTIFYVFGPLLTHLFTSDEAVATLVMSQIIPLIIYQFGDATQTTFANDLRGIAHMKPIMKYAFWSYIIVGVPLMYLLCFTAGLELSGIFIAYFVSLLMAGLLFRHAFIRRMDALTSTQQS